MANEAYTTWYVQGLEAVRTAADQGRAASAGAQAQAAPAEIRDLLDGGAQLFGRHAEMLASLLQRAGGGTGGRPNPFWEGIQTGSRQMMEAAQDPGVREASVVAAAQIATHYFIAAYGTLASNARHLGRDEDAARLKGLADEMKAADEQMTRLAETKANPRAQSDR